MVLDIVLAPGAYLPGDALGLSETQDCHTVGIGDVIGVRDGLGLVVLIADIPPNYHRPPFLPLR